MIVKLLIITLSLTLSVLMFASISWFENEQKKIVRINKEHMRDIKKLKKISKINAWLDNYVKPSVTSLPKEDTAAEENLVKYFDANAESLNFRVNKYIYKDEVSKYLDVHYEVDRNDKSQLKAFSKIRYMDGFLQFKELNIKEEKITGEIQLIQPYQGDNNAS